MGEPSGQFFLDQLNRSAARQPRAEYRLARAGAVDQLEKQVNAALAEGWHLHGSLVVLDEQHVEQFAQFRQQRTLLFLIQPLVRYNPPNVGQA